MYTNYRINSKHIYNQNRTLYSIHENYNDEEPEWFRYVYTVTIFAMVVLFIVIIL